jgi:hypothetical protein
MVTRKHTTEHQFYIDPEISQTIFTRAKIGVIFIQSGFYDIAKWYNLHRIRVSTL